MRLSRPSALAAANRPLMPPQSATEVAVLAPLQGEVVAVWPAQAPTRTSAVTAAAKRRSCQLPFTRSNLATARSVVSTTRPSLTVRPALSLPSQSGRDPAGSKAERGCLLDAPRPGKLEAGQVRSCRRDRR